MIMSEKLNNKSHWMVNQPKTKLENYHLQFEKHLIRNIKKQYLSKIYKTIYRKVEVKNKMLKQRLTYLFHDTNRYSDR